MRKLFCGLILAAAAPAFAAMEPGEWAFSTTSTTASIVKGSTKPGAPVRSSFQNCVRKEDLGNPQRWIQRNMQTDCAYTNIKRGTDSYGWDVSCPKAGWKGNGSAQVAKGRLQGQTRVGGQLDRNESIQITTT